jgi:hypothetical protein
MDQTISVPPDRRAGPLRPATLLYSRLRQRLIDLVALLTGWSASTEKLSPRQVGADRNHWHASVTPPAAGHLLPSTGAL